MNFVNPISRAFLCKYRNGDDFTVNPTTDFVTYLQCNVLDGLKYNATYDVSTITEASPSSQIQASSTGVANIVKLKLTFSNWKAEGFVIGNAVRIEANGNSTNGTVTSIIGNLMYINSASFFINLVTSDGAFRDDYVAKVTTRPTSLIFKFGLIPNDVEANTYTSLLDGQLQAYSKNGLALTLTDLNYLSSESSNLGDVKAKYDSVSGVGNYIFRFTIEHKFRVPHFIDGWQTNYLTGTKPLLFEGLNSLRYSSELNFGVNVANPNDGKIFRDDFELGSVGFNGENFNTGGVNYALTEIQLTVLGDASDTIEVTKANNFTAKIQKLDGNFTSGLDVIISHTKLSNSATYSSNDNTFASNFMLDQLRTSEGAATVSGAIIRNFNADIDGVDASILDISFDVTYSDADKLKLNAGDIVYVGFTVGDIALSAELSDRMNVNLFAKAINKNPDVEELILRSTYEDEYNNIGSTTKTTNIDTWNNRAIENNFSFDLQKPSAYKHILIDSIKFDLVAYKIATGEYFSLDSFNFPLGTLLKTNILGTVYQFCNVNTKRFLSVPESSTLRDVNLRFTIPLPADTGDPSTVTGKIGFIVPWREWILNNEVDLDFYDGDLPPNFNRNYRTSNYSDLLDYEIYVFKTVKISTRLENEYGITDTVTDYILESDTSFVYNFGVDGAGDTWTTVSTKIYNNSDEEIASIDLSGMNKIEIIMAMPTAGTLNVQDALGEIVLEDSLTTGRHYRLHSTLDFFETDNPLLPLIGESFVKITQNVGANQIKLECRCDGRKLGNSNKNIYGHFYN